MLDRLQEVATGQRSLAESYWVWVTMVPAGFSLMLMAVNYFEPQLGSQAAITLSYLLIFIASSIFLVGLAGVFRTKIYSHKGWKIVACVLATLGLYRTATDVWLPLFGAPTISEAAIEREIRLEKAKLPTKIDDHTTLVDIDYSNNQFLYTYELKPVEYNLSYLQTVRKEQCDGLLPTMHQYRLEAINMLWKIKGVDFASVSITPQKCSAFEH